MGGTNRISSFISPLLLLIGIEEHVEHTVVYTFHFFLEFPCVIFHADWVTLTTRKMAYGTLAKDRGSTGLNVILSAGNLYFDYTGH